MSRLIVVLLALSLTAQGQVLLPSVSDAITFGEAINPSIKIARINTEVSEQRLTAAWSSVLPYVTSFGTFDNNVSLPVQLVPAEFLGGNQGEFLEVRFGTRYTATYGVEAGINLINIGNWKNVQASSIGTEISRYELMDRQLTIRENIISAYYLTLLNREATELNRRLVLAGDSLVKAASVRLENGMIEQLEYNRVKRLYLEALQSYKETAGATQQQNDKLKVAIGLTPQDSITLTEKIMSDVKESVELEIDVNEMPRFHALTLRKRQALAELQSNKAQALPVLSMFARYTRQTFSNEPNVFSSNQSWFDVGVIGLRADWKIFTGLQRQSQVKQASLAVDLAQKELDAYQQSEGEALRTLYSNYHVARAGVENYRDHFNLSETNHQIALEKYVQGVYSIDDYVNVYQERVQSQNLFLSKLANFLIYKSIIETRNTLK